MRIRQSRSQLDPYLHKDPILKYTAINSQKGFQNAIEDVVMCFYDTDILANKKITI